MKNIKTKRIYETASFDDGHRILIDRLWPRGLSKEKAKIDVWIRELAPSTDLRKWYGHDPKKWKEFKRRYEAELSDNPHFVDQILDILNTKPVTLLFASKEAHLNNATALKQYLEKRS